MFNVLERKMNSKLTVLVVEDDKALNNLMQKTLKNEDLHAEGVYSGAEAIDKVVKNQNILLLLDYKLPDMSAKQLIDTLSGRQYNIPFIVVTGVDNEQVAVEMIKRGAKNYISKNIALLKLLPALVRKVLYDLELENRIAEADEVIHQKSYYNQIILDRMQCLTLLIEPYTREIIASNATADSVGAMPGKKCYSTWANRNDPCIWCKAPIMWENGEEQQQKFEATGKVWNAYWVPVDDSMYLHYAFDLSGYMTG